ncbi:MAG: ABC transporter permease subunit [Anaerovibrio sp.]|uniref:ABC transporter permease n=1 Tax=Anaerovibrio sp. TaxID=1872532 RepID=UPI0025DFB049|nr:ABC transporter permease subunit [Anaerovibrio sp.]MCR5175631.1 ABC transporter permease subunit [Anaerovibrio sp.]
MSNKFLSSKKQYTGIAVQLVFLLVCGIAWQWYATSRNIMGFPPLDVIVSHLVDSFTSPRQPILVYMAHSFLLIVEGMFIGAVAAVILSGLSVLNNVIGAIYKLLISIFDLLPGVALLPILMITIGANDMSILILVIHSVLWPMSRYIMDGFRMIPKTYIEVGKNFGLGMYRMLVDVYIPASFANVLSGLKVGWARAWRGLISAEMIFGAAQSAGIGVYINNARTIWLDYPGVYGAIFLIILVGVIVEYGFFHVIECRTVKKWGMIK